MSDPDHEEINNKLGAIDTNLAVLSTNLTYMCTELAEQKVAQKEADKKIEKLQTWRSYLAGLGVGISVTLGWLVSHLPRIGS